MAETKLLSPERVKEITERKPRLTKKQREVLRGLSVGYTLLVVQTGWAERYRFDGEDEYQNANVIRSLAEAGAVTVRTDDVFLMPTGRELLKKGKWE